MSDNKETVKLIIEIPRDEYKDIKDHEQMIRIYPTTSLIRILNGKPLSEIKAEIEKKCDRINSIASVLSYPRHREIQELLCEILASIDNAESKAECERTNE